jgi:hypothetical protein
MKIEDMTLVDRIKYVHITPEDLQDFTLVQNQCYEESRTLFDKEERGRYITSKSAQLLATKWPTLSIPESAAKATSIQIRSECLTRLMKDERMRRWVITDEGVEGFPIPNDIALACYHIPYVVFAVAAKSPLHLKGKKSWFEADEFFYLVLKEAEGKEILSSNTSCTCLSAATSGIS